MKKQKGHVIQTIVFGAHNRRAAKIAVLSAFAQRQPDNCEFYITGETKAILANRKPTRDRHYAPARHTRRHPSRERRENRRGRTTL